MIGFFLPIIRYIDIKSLFHDPFILLISLFVIAFVISKVLTNTNYKKYCHISGKNYPGERYVEKNTR